MMQRSGNVGKGKQNFISISISPSLHIATSLLLLAFLVPFPAHATAREELDQTKQDIEQARIHQLELASQAKKLEVELKSLQEKLVTTAQSVQKSESELSSTEDKLRILNEQMETKQDALAGRKKELAALVQAALRLSRTPPEAIIMMPGDTGQAMKASRALKMTSESIRQETESIGLQMAELKRLQEKVAKRRDEQSRQQAKLDQERRFLEDQLAQRQALQAKLNRQQRQEADKLDQLAKKASDLQDLVASIEKEKAALERAPEVKASTGAPRGVRGKLRSFASAKGGIRTPVAGRLVQRFGTPGSHNNGSSKGIAIFTRAGAQVVSPYDGEVVFAGPFLGYGQLVIIRHSDDFHTLLAGFKKIDANAGQFLLEGEPIGAMGESEAGNRLYVELRKNNQPVDPAPWISGLNKKPSGE